MIADRMRRAAGAAASGAPFFGDTWTQADGSVWDPTKWSLSKVYSNVFADVQGGAGHVWATSNGQGPIRAVPQNLPATTDSEVLIELWGTSSGEPGGGVTVTFRASGSWTSASPYDRATDGAVVQVRLDYTGNDGQTQPYFWLMEFTNDAQVGSAGSWTPATKYPNGTKFWLRARVKGSTLYARVWQDGTTEPTAWGAQKTLANAHAGTSVWFGFAPNSASTTNPLYVDNLTLSKV